MKLSALKGLRDHKVYLVLKDLRANKDHRGLKASKGLKVKLDLKAHKAFQEEMV